MSPTFSPSVLLIVVGDVRGSRSPAPVAKVGRLGGLKSGLDVVIKQMRPPVTDALVSYSFNSSSFSLLVPAPGIVGSERNHKDPSRVLCFPRTGESRLSEGEPFRLPPSWPLLTDYLGTRQPKAWCLLVPA